MKAIDDLLRDLCDPAKVTTENLGVLRSALADLKVKNRLELSKGLQEKDMSPMFSSLVTFQGEEAESFCEVIRCLLDCLPADVLLEKYEVYVGNALKDSNSVHIQRLALGQLYRCAKDPKVCPTLLRKTAMLSLVVEKLAVSSILINDVEKVLLEMTRNCKDGVMVLFEGDILKKMELVMHHGSVQSLRIMELYCKVACQSEENCGKMKPRLNIITESVQKEKSDVLVLLSYIEVLSLLVVKPYTLKYLMDSSILSILDGLLVKQSDRLSSFYLPGVINFFGLLGHHSPSLLVVDHSSSLKCILSLCSDSPFSEASISAVAHTARSSGGKRLLDKHIGREMVNYVKLLGKILEGQDNAAKKTAAIVALSWILEMEDFNELDVISVTEKWLGHLSRSPLDLVWKQAKVPFEEHRTSAHIALRNIALLPWGRKALLFQLPGFYEWLLDRSTEPEKGGKETKHAIVAALLEEVNSIGDEEKVAGLRKFFMDGPFYAPAETAVSFQGA